MSILRGSPQLQQIRAIPLHLSGIILLLLLVLTFVNPVAGVEYEIQGTAKHSWMKSAGKEVSRMEEKSFRVSVHDEKWMIALYPKGGTNATNRLWQTVASENGTTIIHTRHAAKGWAIVIVETNFFPMGFNIPVPTHLWMVYASGSFFTNWNGTNLSPVYKYAYEFYGNTFPRPKYMDQSFAVLFHDQEPRLPTSIQFFNGGWTELPRTNLPPRQMRKPFENGYLNATYEMDDFRKTGDLTIPWHFVFKKLTPNLNGKSSNEVHVGIHCEVQVTSVTNKCSRDLQEIGLPRQFVAVDHRLENASNPVVGVSYNHAESKKLPDMEQLTKISLRPKPVPRPPNKLNSGRNKMLLVLLLVLLPAPILLAVAARGKRDKRAKVVR